jgi:hypothetical protein
MRMISIIIVLTLASNSRILARPRYHDYVIHELWKRAHGKGDEKILVQA